MFSLADLNPKGFELSDEQKRNLPLLREKINSLTAVCPLKFVVTSGVRSVEDHKRIYMEKAKREGIANPRIPMGSMHLKGAAVDIADSSGALQRWCRENVHVLEEIGLWMEDFSATPGWCHFQSIPPKSGKRFYIPF